ncbi:sensor histidine kinase [Tistrella mobilis]|uniref:sensor histidine kinase n=1 Tax=Tistrella mobilis TaxID=171437 RepID=UPI00355764E5
MTFDLTTDRRKIETLRRYRVLGSESAPALSQLVTAAASALDATAGLLVGLDERGPRVLAGTQADGRGSPGSQDLFARVTRQLGGEGDEDLLLAAIRAKDGTTIAVLALDGCPRMDAHATAVLQRQLDALGAVMDLGVTVATALDQADRLAAHEAELTHQSSLLEQQAEELVRLAEENYAQRLSAEGAFQQKSLFLATLTHELRTPLTAIIGFAELMEQQVLGPIGNETYLGYLNSIHGSGKHLLSIINDLLDMAKIEAGKYDVTPTAMAANPVLSQTIRVVGGLAIEKRVRIAWTPLRPSPEIVADDRALKQVMLNLLSNAIKYSPPGGSITVDNRVQHDRFVVAISDEGPGIAPEDLARLMRPYEQARNGGAETQVKGTGLGLTISRMLVELQGGTLTLESTEGRGTTSCFDLPLAAPDARRAD